MAAALLLAAGGAGAYPDGAPWGASDPDATESCASCHYDYEPVMDSAALSVEGLPEIATPGRRYRLALAFASDTAVTSGFQLTIRGAGKDNGMLVTRDEDVEVVGAAGRSTSPRPVGGELRWHIEWQAPDAEADCIEFLIAASAANDDQSPFGDTIHYKAVAIDVAAPVGD